MKIITDNLNEMAAQVHEINRQWWHDLVTGEPLQRNRGELLMLVVTELAEAVEGIRKDLMDDKLPHRKMEEVEMADAFIRLLDYSAGFKLGALVPHILSEGEVELPENKSESILLICKNVCLVYCNPDDERYIVSDALERIRRYGKHHGLDLKGAYEEKLRYNIERQDHKAEARLGKHGKKF
jgi:hypothetical protein